MGNDLKSSLETVFDRLESFVTTKTVVGEPFTSGDVILIPLVDVSFGMGAGAYEKTAEKDKHDGGGCGIGASVKPAAVLAIINGTVQMVQVNEQDSVSKLLDLAPNILGKLNLSNLFGKNKKDAKTEDTAAPQECP